MAMKRNATTTRKPPQPAESHADIDDWMRHVMPHLNPIVTRLDELIRETDSDLQFAVKWNKAYYGLPDVGWMLEMVSYHVSVNVVFFGGADFDPPPPLGDSDRSRYIKLRTMEEIEQPELKSWIGQARHVAGWKQ